MTLAHLWGVKPDTLPLRPLIAREGLAGTGGLLLAPGKGLGGAGMRHDRNPLPRVCAG